MSDKLEKFVDNEVLIVYEGFAENEGLIVSEGVAENEDLVDFAEHGCN